MNKNKKPPHAQSDFRKDNVLKEQKHCISSITHNIQNVNLCCECGAVVTDSEAATYLEKHGLSEPPFEEFAYCPHCGGDLNPAERCIVCGSYEEKGTLHHGICRKCCEEHKDKFTRQLGEAYIKASDQQLEFYAFAAGLKIEVESSCLVEKTLTAWLKEQFEKPLRCCWDMAALKKVNQELTGIFKDYIFREPAESDNYFYWLSGEIEKELGKGD